MKLNSSFPLVRLLSCPTPRLLIFIFLQMNNDSNRICPKCDSINVFTRTRKKPKYKCKNCDCEFDEPDTKIKFETFKQKRDYCRQYSYLDE